MILHACDLDIDPVTFMCETNPYLLKVYLYSKYGAQFTKNLTINLRQIVSYEHLTIKLTKKLRQSYDKVTMQ